MRRALIPFDRHATVILISAMIVLILLGFARIYTVTQDLKAAQTAACQLRREGRANTNGHDRVPLRAALQYLGRAVVVAAPQQNDPAKRQATVAFGNQLLAYAQLVQPLPNPKC